MYENAGGSFLDKGLEDLNRSYGEVGSIFLLLVINSGEDPWKSCPQRLEMSENLQQCLPVKVPSTFPRSIIKSCNDPCESLVQSVKMTGSYKQLEIIPKRSHKNPAKVSKRIPKNSLNHSQIIPKSFPNHFQIIFKEPQKKTEICAKNPEAP